MIDVSAAVVFQKIGRRVLGQSEIQEIGASVQNDGPDYDNQPDEDMAA